MENTEYNEDLIVTSGLNLQLSSQTYLIDLLRLEYSQELRFSFALLYLQEISKGSQFKIFENLQDLQPNSIVLLPDWTACIFSNKIYSIHTNSTTLDNSRANLKKTLQNKNIDLDINTIEIMPQKGFTYILIYFCKTFVRSLHDIEELVKSCNFEAFKTCVRNEVASFIYASTRLSAKTVLFKINEAKELLQTDCSDMGEESRDKIEGSVIVEKYSIRAVYKPLAELLVNTLHRSSLESLEYTQSEETNKAETSFRLSNTITGRFPRLSGSSIALVDTPSKDTKKSFGEYAECMESPRFSSKNVSPSKALSSTPINSPKQALYTIQEVKNFLIPGQKIVERCVESPFDKISVKKNRTSNLRTFSFQDTIVGAGVVDIIGIKEGTRLKTVFEEKKSSCQCQSCYIF